MSSSVEGYGERFETALFLILQNLGGPRLIKRANIELTPGQVYMLRFIQREVQCNPSKLAEHMEVSPSAVTIMLDRLENHGYVERKRDTEDRRVVTAALTKAGEAALNEIHQFRRRITEYCLAKLQADELGRFVNTLEELGNIAEQMDIEEILELKKGVER